jgi:voltage-gated sodium channel
MWRTALVKIFCSERIVTLAILLNAAAITCLYFPRFNHDPLLMTLDKAFTIFFTIEAICKICTLGAKHYFGSTFHRFDFFLILAGVPSLLVGVVDLPDTSFLLLLRVLRLLRLLRFLQFVPHIDRLLSGLIRAMKASLLVLIILAFFNFVLAIFTCHFFAQIAPDEFGDPLLSLFSIFQIFTVEGWNEIPAEISDKMKENNQSWYAFNSYTLIALTRFYFGTIVLLGGIFGLSLANAVFVDEMTMDNTDTIDHKIDDLQQQLAEIQRQLATAVMLLNQQQRGLLGDDTSAIE